MDNDYNIPNDEYAYLILALCAQQQAGIGKLLEELERELRLTNRFFPNNKLTQIVESLASKSSRQIKKGTKLYRCRLIGKEDEYKFLKRYTDPCVETIQRFIPSFDADNAEEQVKFYWYLTRHPEKTNLINEAFCRLKEQFSQVSFWGYDEAGSDAPPADVPASGRSNPDGISYLYAAGDIKTAILEVRPVPTQYVSVAQLEVLDDITIYSFAKPMVLAEDGEDWLSWSSHQEISRYFTRPHYGGSTYYLATQYISEYIKHMKDNDGHTIFDGLCFQSSLNPDGINYVFFDVSENKKYQICNSSLYQVEDLLGNSKCILPYSPNQD